MANFFLEIICIYIIDKNRKAESTRKNKDQCTIKLQQIIIQQTTFLEQLTHSRMVSQAVPQLKKWRAITASVLNPMRCLPLKLQQIGQTCSCFVRSGVILYTSCLACFCLLFFSPFSLLLSLTCEHVRAKNMVCGHDLDY